MIDSWGKPGSGIFQLGTKWLGDFDECQDVQSASSNPNITLPDYLNFQGQYCVAGNSLGQTLGKAPISGMKWIAYSLIRPTFN